MDHQQRRQQEQSVDLDIAKLAQQQMNLKDCKVQLARSSQISDKGVHSRKDFQPEEILDSASSNFSSADDINSVCEAKNESVAPSIRKPTAPTTGTKRLAKIRRKGYQLYWYINIDIPPIDNKANIVLSTDGTEIWDSYLGNDLHTFNVEVHRIPCFIRWPDPDAVDRSLYLKIEQADPWTFLDERNDNRSFVFQQKESVGGSVLQSTDGKNFVAVSNTADSLVAVNELRLAYKWTIDPERE